ncbi:hypothetical protein [Sphingomonas panacisoli]|nr:hypothetical protein [Sphingomonas panacisoli]
MIKTTLRLVRSMPVRTAIVAFQLICVYALSMKDAAFFYQQF